MSEKVYARQINPEYQESPLFIEDFFPEDIILTGNRQYKAHTTPAYDQIIENFDDMAETWDGDGHYYVWENGAYVTYPRKRELILADVLRYYGFEREDGKPWTTRQRHKWRLMMESGKSAEDDEIILAALELITGHKWEAGSISGSCQGDYQDIYYQADAWTREAIDAFECEYFNYGSEWIIHDEDTALETPEDISGYSVYCHGCNDDRIRAEIAAIAGVDPADVVLYAFDGYQKIEIYREVV